MAEKQHHVPVTLSCPLCGAPSRIDVTRKFSADQDSWRIYIAACPNCGTVQIKREPQYVSDVVCGTCAGRLSWTCDLDTSASLTSYPLHCAQCARVSNAGVRFSGATQNRLLHRLQKLDRIYDALWLRASTIGDSNEEYHEAAMSRARHLERKRTRILKRLQTSAESRPVELVNADTIGAEQ